MCSTLSQAHVARARQLPQHLLQRQAPGTLPLQAPHLLHRPRFLAPFAIPRLRSRGGRLRLGLRLFGRFKRRRIPADVADQTLPLGPLDQRCVHPLRPLALRKFGERARAYALVRHPRRRLPTAQPPQHNVGPQAVQQRPRRRQIEHRLGHAGARDRGAVMRRPRPQRTSTNASNWSSASVRTNCCCRSLSAPNSASSTGNSRPCKIWPNWTNGSRKLNSRAASRCLRFAKDIVLGIAAPSKQFLLNLFPLTAAIFASPSGEAPHHAAVPSCSCVAS